MIDTQRTFEVEQIAKQDLPTFISDQIRSSEEVIKVEHKPNIPTTNRSHMAQMAIVGEELYGLSVIGYELWQGIDDWGWESQKPSWRRPGIEMKFGEQKVPYDGKHSFNDVSSVEFHNSGTFNFGSLSRIDSNGSGRSAESDARKGMYGMGLKFAILAALLRPEDRAQSLDTYSKEGKGMKELDILSAVNRLKELKEADSHTYITVQAREAGTNLLKRAYLYREAVVADTETVSEIGWCFASLDESKVPENERDQVIITIHNPGSRTKQSLANMPKSLLQLNPEYKDPKNLVARVHDQESTTSIRTKMQSLQRLLGNRFQSGPGDQIQIEQIQTLHPDGSGAVYLRKQRLISSEMPGMQLLFDYNFEIGQESAAMTSIKRESDSVMMSGRIPELISSMMQFVDTKEEWVTLLTHFRQLSESHSDELGLWPELNPSFPEGQFQNLSKEIEDSFDQVWPNADHKFALSQKDLDVWKLLHPEDLSTCPVFAEGRMADCLKKAGCKEISSMLKLELSKESALHTAGTIDIQIIPKERIEKQCPPSSDSIFDLMKKNDPLDLKGTGQSYKISSHGDIAGLEIKVDSDSLVKQMKDLLTQFTDPVHGEVNSTSTSELLGLFVQAQRSELAMTLKLSDESRYYLKRAPGGDYILFSNSGRGYILDELSQCVLMHPDRKIVRSMWSTFDTLAREYFPSMVRNKKDEGNEGGLTPDELELLELLEMNDMDAIRNDSNLKKKLKQLLGELDLARTKNKRLLIARKERLASVDGSENALHSLNLDAQTQFSQMLTSRKNTIYGRASTGSRVGRSQVENHTNVLENVGMFFGGYDASLITTNPENFQYFPLECTDTIERFDKEEFRCRVSQDSPHVISDKKDFWYSYSPDRDRRALDISFDALLTLDKRIQLQAGSSVLPIDARKYEVIAIELPITKDFDPQLESDTIHILYDDINTQYCIDNENEDEAIVPSGVRIYLKKRSFSRDVQSVEDVLVREHSSYYFELTRVQVDVSALTPQERKLVETIREQKLTRTQKVAALSQYWGRRFLYSNNHYPSSMEDLLNNPKGDCLWSQVGFQELCRIADVPCRSRTVYGGEGKKSVHHSIGGSLHGIIEYLDDEGEWQLWDPPQGLMDQDFHSSLIDAMQNLKKLPFLPDASVMYKKKEHTEIELPQEINDLIQAVPISKGVELIPELGAAISQYMMNGVEPTGSEIQELLKISREELLYVTSKNGPYDYLDREKVAKMDINMRRVVLHLYDRDVRTMKSRYQRLVWAIAGLLTKKKIK